MEDAGEERVKRRRIAIACQTCQKKKVKCNGQKPCGYCRAHDADCVFTRSRVRSFAKHHSSSSSSSSYMHVLGDRLSTLESLLAAAGPPINLSPPPTAGVAVAGVRPPAVTTISSLDALPSPTPERAPSLSLGLPRDTSPPSSPSARDHDHSPQRAAAAVQQTTLSHSTDAGDRQRAASLDSDAFTIALPSSLQSLINNVAGAQLQTTLAAAARSEPLSDCWSSTVFKDVFTRPVFAQLPPKKDAVALVNLWFREVNSAWPLFSQPTFMALLDQQYSSSPCTGAGWWASLNALIAGALMLKADRDSRTACLERAQGFVKNAMAVLSELVIRSTRLIDLQAVLCINVVLQWLPDPRPSSFLVPLALRIAHTLGLHKRQTYQSMDPLEGEQQRRVFWMVYRADKELSLRSGLPNFQHDDDMDIDLPALDPPDNLGLMTFQGGQTTLNVFRAQCQLAVIESHIYRQVYTEAASKKSEEALLASIAELDNELEEWREQMPIDLEDLEYEMLTAPVPLNLCLIALQFTYYNCRHMVHRSCLRHSYFATQTEFPHNVPPNMRLFQSFELCMSSARASLRLLRCLPIHDIGFIWRVIFFPISAFLVLFANTLHRPTCSQARSDLRLMRSIVTFISKAQHQDSQVLNHIAATCSGLEQIARRVVEQAMGTRSTDTVGTALPSTTPPSTGLTNGFFELQTQPEFNNAAHQVQLSGLNLSSFLDELQPILPHGLLLPLDYEFLPGTCPSDPIPTASFEF